MRTKNVKRSRILALLLAFVLLAGVGILPTNPKVVKAAIQATYYVSPTGNDNNAGTLSAPYKTITKARDKVRTINSNMTGDIYVYLRSGDYFTDTTITFNESDSGTNGYKVYYNDYDGTGSARIIGGAKITNWTLDSGNIYKANIGTGWNFDVMYENEEKAFMARFPNSGYKKIDKQDGAFPKKAFYYKNNDVPTVATVTDLQVYVWPGNHDWANEILPVASISYANKKVTLTQNQRWAYLDNLSSGSRYFVQGAKELLDVAGEFYVDKINGYVYYYPRNSDINNQDIVAPKVERVLLFNGSTNTNRVKNIELNGLTVMVSNATYDNMNGGITGNIILMNTENITIKNCKIRNSASDGIAMPSKDLQSPAVKTRNYNNVIYGNQIEDVGDSGVKGSGTVNTMDYTSTGHLISNNEINGVARNWTNGSGVYLANCGNSEVSYNKITNCTHYGIQIKGSKWKEMPGVIEGITVTTANRYDFDPGRYVTIKFNDVSKCNLDAQDTGIFKCGGIYACTIENNVLHDSGNFGLQKGLYLDDISDYNTVTKNIVYKLKGGSKYIYNVKGTGNVVTNNIADCTGGGAAFQLNIISGQPTTNNSFSKNIAYNGSVLYKISSWHNQMITSSDNNTFYSPSGTHKVTGIPGSDTYTNWKNILNDKYDQHSITSNPLFVDAVNHNYTLQANSPSLALNFEQIDISTVGLKADYVYGQAMFSMLAEELPAPEVPYFSDGFENGFGNWTANYGTPTLSTTRIYEGANSYFPDQEQDEIMHEMGEVLEDVYTVNDINSVCKVWFYDVSSDNSMKTKAMVSLISPDEKAQIGVATGTSTAKYCYQVDGTNWVVSSVNRTTGWHEFKFDLSSGEDCKLYIDGTLIATTDIITSFDRLTLGDNSTGGTSGNVNFDAVVIDAIPQ